MTRAQLLLAAGLAATFACSPGDSSKVATPAAAGPDGATVVATLNGTDIRASELENWIKEDLYKREVGEKPAAEVYDVRATAIESLIDERLLADAAKKAGKTPDEFRAAQIAAMGPVSDDEVK